MPFLIFFRVPPFPTRNWHLCGPGEPVPPSPGFSSPDFLRKTYRYSPCLTLFQSLFCQTPDNFSRLRTAFLTIQVCFLHNLFTTILHKIPMWQISMIFGCWAITLFLRPCQDPVNANVFACSGYFHLSFYIYDKYSSPWRFKCNSATNQVQLLVGGPVEVIRRQHIWRHRRARKRFHQ